MADYYQLTLTVKVIVLSKHMSALQAALQECGLKPGESAAPIYNTPSNTEGVQLSWVSRDLLGQLMLSLEEQDIPYSIRHYPSGDSGWFEQADDFRVARDDSRARYTDVLVQGSPVVLNHPRLIEALKQCLLFGRAGPFKPSIGGLIDWNRQSMELSDHGAATDAGTSETQLDMFGGPSSDLARLAVTDSRDQFESWYSRGMSNPAELELALARNFWNEDYIVPETQEAWETWQASRHQLLQQYAEDHLP